MPLRRHARATTQELERKLQRQLLHASTYSCAVYDSARGRREIHIRVRKLRVVQCIVKLGAKFKTALLTSQFNTTVLMNEGSRLACPGPFTIPVALFPNAVPIPSEANELRTRKTGRVEIDVEFALHPR